LAPQQKAEIPSNRKHRYLPPESRDTFQQIAEIPSNRKQRYLPPESRDTFQQKAEIPSTRKQRYLPPESRDTFHHKPLPRYDQFFRVNTGNGKIVSAYGMKPNIGMKYEIRIPDRPACGLTN
jgi:hypothetical protein